jgi:hypothetical protein
MVTGFTNKTRGLGAMSFRNDLSLESRTHITEFAKNIEKMNRYFQIPYDEHTSTNYCSSCLTAQGTTPLHWQSQLELCGHNATAAKDSILNQYIQTLHTQTIEWYESQKVLAHEQVVLNITNDTFAPEILTADPRIIEWTKRVSNDARSRIIQSIDQEAKQMAEDQFQTALIQYQISHENDLERTRDDLHRDLDSLKDSYQQKLDEVHREWQLKIDEAKSRPLIVDPIARKKRRGSVSAINSPTITKRQPIDTSSMSSTVPDSQPVPSIILAPDAHDTPQPHNPHTAEPTDVSDPLTKIMNMMSQQFGQITERLNKLESNKANDYSTWGPSTWDADKNQSDQDALKDSYDTAAYDNLNYDDHGLYDDPPNDTNFMSDAICPDEEFPSNTPIPISTDHDSDCVLLSDPPTPTQTKAPSGLRPPERAQRVDFTSTKLATDSFGIPTGGRCNADGTVSYDNAKNTRNNKPKVNATHYSLPEHMIPFTAAQLPSKTKEAIISHAKVRFPTQYRHEGNKGSGY